MTKEQKKEVYAYLNNNPLMNIFGLVNLSSVKGHVYCLSQTEGQGYIKDKELKKYINEVFGPEMINGEVEFMIPKLKQTKP